MSTVIRRSVTAAELNQWFAGVDAANEDIMSARPAPVEVMGWKPQIPGWNLPDDFDEPTWRDLALCAETDPELFFVEKGGTARPAKRICRQCEVRAECLDYAMANGERFGIWGGLTERERGMVKRTVSDIADTAPARCRSGRHLKTPENTGGEGRCTDCKREYGIARRPARADRLTRAGSIRPGRDISGRFAPCADQNAAA